MKNPFESNDGMGMLLESFMPKIQQFIDPLYKKLGEYLHEEDKIIVIRSGGENTPARAFVFSLNKGVTIVGSETPNEKIFSAEPEAVKQVFDGNEFITALLNGDFTKIQNMAQAENEGSK